MGSVEAVMFPLVGHRVVENTQYMYVCIYNKSYLVFKGIVSKACVKKERSIYQETRLDASSQKDWRGSD